MANESIKEHVRFQSSENNMDVDINFGCFGTGFKSLFKKNLNSYRKEEEQRKQ